MAKKSKIVKEQRRRVIVERYAARRAELKALMADAAASTEEKESARAELARQPRDASATRLRNRDAVDGRPRGYIGKAGISRVRFREMAHRGELPGIRKASW
ncbi:small subunit ribosomal protein S14 [Gordonia malaquae]|uniref:Small ribosomal subunit protein uS14 n=1 Tax=Gordonia malaquae NBRC 108250 TaxID=1223542 RepID=M3UUI6_GORML|nr:30S ribosomal protein S14 [Gordonia malaquae]GAC79102.1 30S ribosomal protein S14 [Gordonia malaquae NBRC 108250]SEE10028.1 small subunit ribosomal protein S14 [Gordonia malaquae]